MYFQHTVWSYLFFSYLWCTKICIEWNAHPLHKTRLESIYRITYHFWQIMFFQERISTWPKYNTMIPSTYFLDKIRIKPYHRLFFMDRFVYFRLFLTSFFIKWVITKSLLCHLFGTRGTIFFIFFLFILQ